MAFKRKIGIIKSGKYLWSWSPTHPYRNKSNRIFQHRLVIDLYYSIKCGHPVYLKRGVDIHHIDGNKENNNLSNLEILSMSNHAKITYKDNKFPKKDMKNRYCLKCGGISPFNNRGHQTWYIYKDGFECYKCYSKDYYYKKKKQWFIYK